METEDIKKQGMLYLCATPIGNLRDMTPRAVEILKEVDLIAAEDTRNSIKLMNHFEIRTPMTSYHEFNRFEKAEELVRKMQEGKTIACITDAGTPGISDPGEVLVAECYKAGIPVTTIPGACACINALIISGLSTRRFRFEGFLSPDKKEKARILEETKNETATLIFYEAPHHLVKTLGELLEAYGDRRIALVKELTKKHESVIQTTLKEARSLFSEEEPRGEFVIVIEGRNPDAIQKENEDEWSQMPIEEHMKLYEERGIDRKEAMKMVAKDRGISKRDVYRELLESEASL